MYNSLVEVEGLVERTFGRARMPYPLHIAVGYESAEHQAYRIIVKPNRPAVIHDTYIDFACAPLTRTVNFRRIYVEQDLQHRGYGRRLVRAMENVGKALGCDHVNAGGVAGSGARFLAKLGYSANGHRFGKNLGKTKKNGSKV